MLGPCFINVFLLTRFFDFLPLLTFLFLFLLASFPQFREKTFLLPPPWYSIPSPPPPSKSLGMFSEPERQRTHRGRLRRNTTSFPFSPLQNACECFFFFRLRLGDFVPPRIATFKGEDTLRERPHVYRAVLVPPYEALFFSEFPPLRRSIIFSLLLWGQCTF